MRARVDDTGGERANLELGQRFRLDRLERPWRRAQAERFTGLVGRFFPDAPTPALRWISDWTSWLFWRGVTLERHVQGLRDLMRGNLDWSLGSARYTLQGPPTSSMPGHAAIGPFEFTP